MAPVRGSHIRPLGTIILLSTLLRKWLGGLMWCGGCSLEWAVEDQGHRPFLLGLRQHTLNEHPPPHYQTGMV